MTRDEFEAALWRRLGPYATPATIDAILKAAESYAITQFGPTADRRAVLAGVSSRRLHYIPSDGDDGDEFACHPAGSGIGTTDPERVTCIRCLRTDAYSRSPLSRKAS